MRPHLGAGQRGHVTRQLPVNASRDLTGDEAEGQDSARIHPGAAESGRPRSRRPVGRTNRVQMERHRKVVCGSLLFPPHVPAVTGRPQAKEKRNADFGSPSFIMKRVIDTDRHLVDEQ